jgi:hypothetical protein
MNRLNKYAYSMPAFEAVDFQISSKLGSELTRVFQQAIDFVNNNIEYDKENKNYNTTTQRHLQLHTYCQNILFPNMQKVIESTANLEIKKIVASSGPTGFFAVDLTMDNSRDLMDMLGMQTGQAEPPKNYRESLKETMEMYKNLDISKGVLKDFKYGKGNKRRISVVLYFDPFVAFVPKDFVPENRIQDFTAEELTAIYLHEIGHALTTVERSIQTYFTIDRCTKHIPELLKNTKDKEGVQAFAEFGLPVLEKAKQDGILGQAEYDTITQAYESAKYIAESSDTEELNIMAYIELYMHVQFVIMLTCTITMPVFVWIKFLMGMVSGLEEFSGLKDAKTSDTIMTKHNMYNMERIADEFVVRHGYGQYQASALNKLTTMFEYMDAQRTPNMGHFRKSRIFSMYIRYVVFIMRMIGISPNITEGFITNYETLTARIKRLAQDQIGIFKHTLKGAALNEAITSYENIMREVEDIDKQLDRKAAKLIYTYLFNSKFTMKFIASILTGRLANDYDKLQNQVEELINNRLYYQSAKFRQLALRK